MITLQIIIIETVIASARSGLQPPEWRGSTSTKCKAGKVSSSRCRIPRRPILSPCRSERPTGPISSNTRTLGRTDARTATGAVHRGETLGVGRSDGTDARRARGETAAQSDGEAVARPFSSPPLYHCQKRPYRICSGFWLCSGKMLRTLANPGAALPWGIAWLHLSSVFVDSFGPPWPPRH